VAYADRPRVVKNFSGARAEKPFHRANIAQVQPALQSILAEGLQVAFAFIVSSPLVILLSLIGELHRKELWRDMGHFVKFSCIIVIRVARSCVPLNFN
jgi:hypothetical protein